MADTGRGRGRSSRGRGRGRGRVSLSTTPEDSTPSIPSVAGSTSQLHTSSSTHAPSSSRQPTIQQSHTSEPAPSSSRQPTIQQSHPSEPAPSSSTQPTIQQYHTSEPSGLDEGRILIAPGDVHLEFDLTRGPADAISDIIRSKFQGPWTCWREVPTAEKDMWFAKFRETYRWLSAHERQIRKIFDHKGQKSLKNAMNKLRAGKGKSDWVSPSIKEQLQSIWDSPQWKEKSDKAKQNRAVDRGASSYTGGSVSTAEHRKRLKEQLQREPSGFEIMERTKKLKEGDWACQKAADVVREYQRLRGQSTSTEGDSSLAADNALFLELVGGRKPKGNVWSQGELGSLLLSSTGASSSSVTDNVELTELRARVTALTEELMGKDAIIADTRETLADTRESLADAHERLRRNEQRMEFLYQRLCIDTSSVSSAPHAQAAAA